MHPPSEQLIIPLPDLHMGFNRIMMLRNKTRDNWPSLPPSKGRREGYDQTYISEWLPGSPFGCFKLEYVVNRQSAGLMWGRARLGESSLLISVWGKGLIVGCTESLCLVKGLPCHSWCIPNSTLICLCTSTPPCLPKNPGMLWIPIWLGCSL